MKMVCFCEKVHFRFYYGMAKNEISIFRWQQSLEKIKTLYYLCQQINSFK